MDDTNIRDKPKRRSKFVENVAGLGFYTILAIIVTWPAIVHLQDRVLGAYPGDNFQFLWALWYTAHAIFDLHTSPFFDPNIYFPFGFSLFRNLGEVSPATILISIPFTRCFGEVATYNVLIILSFALTGFGTFLLARELRAGYPGSLIAGIGVGFCAYHFAHAAGHLSLASTQWIPFFFLYLERSVRKPAIRNAVLLGVFYSLSALVSWYYASLLPVMALLYLTLRVGYFKKPKRVLRLTRPGLIAAACAAALILPFVVPYMLAVKHGTMQTRSVNESQAFSASVADFFIPPVRHPVFGHWVTQHWRSGTNGVWGEWELYLGTLILPLALLGVVGSKHRRITAGLLAMGAGAFVLALGPSLYIVHPAPLNGAANLAPLSSIPLPVLALKDIPPFSFLRAWARVGFFLELALSLLAARGCSYLLELITRHIIARHAVAVTLVTLATFDSMTVPLGMANVTPRPVDRWLATQPGMFAVMEYPIPEHAYSGPAMYSTRFTGKRIVMGYASNPPNAPYFETLNTFPSPEALDLLQEWETKFILVDDKLYQNGSEFMEIWQTWQSLKAAIRESGRLQEVITLGGVHVYQLLPRDVRPVSEELIANPGFEAEAGGHIEGWTQIGHPVVDHSTNQARSGRNSCLVTPLNYLVSKPIPIESGRCYRVQLFGKRVKNQTARIRLQIGWLDTLKRPLSPATTSVRVVELLDQWQSARAQFVAPPESHYAQIFAVTETGAARVDDYSFRQVTLGCEPSLSAIPNPAIRPPGTDVSRTSILWDSHSGTGSHVDVSVNGKPETRFADGSSGMRSFQLEASSICEFRLYASISSTSVKTTIVMSEQILPLSASSVLFLSPSEPGRTTISWNMPKHPETEVWVSQNGSPDQLFVRGASGSQEARWIVRGSTYHFKMYALIPKRTLIAELTVRATDPSP